MVIHRRCSNLPNVRRVKKTIVLAIYLTEQEAINAIEKYKKTEGFMDYPDGWMIEQISINEVLENPIRIR